MRRDTLKKQTALKNIDTVTVAEALLEIYCRMGIPEEVLSDLGRQFTSSCMKEVARLLKIKQVHTSVYHPICNGLTEKFNGSLKMMLKRLCHEQPKRWHRFLGPLLFAYREVPQESTGFSPFELIYGRSIKGPLQIVKELWTEEIPEYEVRNSYVYAIELQERIEETLKLAKENLEKAQNMNKHYYDRRTKERIFKKGDLVLILLPTESNKLLMHWKGPYEVMREKGGNNYIIEINGSTRTFHANLLKKYVKRIDMEREILNEGNIAIIDNYEDHEEETEEQLEMIECLKKEEIKDIKIGNDIKQNQKDQIMKICEEYKKIFTELPGETKMIKHTIKLTTDETIRMKPYNIPYAARTELKEEVKKMMEIGIIRISNSVYASPIVMMKKKDGNIRVCADFRKIKFDPEPM